MVHSDLSRREFLVGTGAAGLGALAAGPGSAAAGPPERHIVGARTAAAVDAARSRADAVHRVIELGDYPTAVAGTFPEAAREALAERADVAYVEPDVEHEVIGETLPWGIDRTDADVAHANGETGGDGDDGEGGANIAIIDTGIDDDHPDLEANLATPLGDSTNHRAFVSCRGGNCNYAWSDDHDHGTHVSGTANAVDDSAGVIGVSTAATLHAAKVSDKAGFCSSSDIAAGIEWAADNGADVANLSLGGSYSQTVDNAGQYAYDKGVLLVAAAGNDGPCTDCVGYPAANEEFIAVSATTCDDTLAGFSSTGPEVDLAAPGDSVYSSVIGGYDTFSGTSMASPHVAGAGAQLMDNGDSNVQARDALGSSAEDLGLAGNEQGQGLVDVAASLGLDSTDDGLGNGPNCGSDGGGGGGDNAPTVDSLSLGEDNSGGSPHADFDASWSVSDGDGDLDTVDLTLADLDDGETEDSASVDVSGSDASGTTGLTAKHEENSGHEYEVELVVTDSNGNTASATATEVEDGA